jgi:hypothetical protein
MVAELLLMLARDGDLRRSAGQAARAFIEETHSLDVMIDGYRTAIAHGLGIEMPQLRASDANEIAPVIERKREPLTPYTSLDARIADALAGLRLGGHDATIRAVARASVGLRLDRLTPKMIGSQPDEPVTPDP